jgi:ribosome-associated toxin RatA of RatAB toxin-antitoxin module
MKYPVFTCWSLVLALAAGNVLADDCLEWRRGAVIPEGTLYHRCRPGSAIKDVMIETQFHTRPERLFQLVNDYAAFAEFVPDVKVSRVLADDGVAQWVYHQLHVPGPVADRAYILKSTRIAQGPQHWRVEWALSGRVFPGVNMRAGVRPSQLSGFWEFEPAEEAAETVTAHYALRIDPGGMVPTWLAQRMADRYVQRVIAAFRRQLGE